MQVGPSTLSLRGQFLNELPEYLEGACMMFDAHFKISLVTDGVRDLQIDLGRLSPGAVAVHSRFDPFSCTDLRLHNCSCYTNQGRLKSFYGYRRYMMSKY